jgi:hypothetical protein
MAFETVLMQLNNNKCFGTTCEQIQSSLFDTQVGKKGWGTPPIQITVRRTIIQGHHPEKGVNVYGVASLYC